MNFLDFGEYSTSGNPAYPLFDPTLDGSYYLENTDPTGLPTGNAERSIFCWVKVPVPTTTQVLFGYGTTNDDDHQMELIYNESYRELCLYWNQVFSPVAYYGNSNYVLGANTWYLVGATFDGSVLSLHVAVNGRISHSGCGTGGISTSEEIIRLGLGMCHFSAVENVFKGTIAKAGIWNRCLDNSEVEDLYNAGRVNYIDLPFQLRHIRETHLANSVARTNHINDFATRRIEVADLVTQASDLIETSGGFTLQVQTGVIETIETSNGWALTVCKPTYANIVTSSGAFLEFAKKEYVVGGIVSYWNLNETDGTRHDSLGNNHLNCMQMHAEFNVDSIDVPVGVEITFTDASILATSWFWEFGDSSTSTDQNPTHIFPFEGSFTVTLTINGGYYQGHHLSELLTTSVVMSTHSPVASFTDNSPQMFGDAITFTDTSFYPFGSWLWDFGDGNSSTTQSPSHTYSEVGSYTVTLTTAQGAASVNHLVTINDRNEIQQFSFSPTPISGTYTITVNGQTTDPINWNASAGDIQDILSTTIGNNISVS